MTTVILVGALIAWPAFTFLLGVVVGRSIHAGNQRRPGELTHPADLFERSPYGRKR